jgi:predicted amidohydrolase YtcJ
MSQTIYNSSTLPGGQVSPIYRGDATVRLADRVIRAGAIYSMASDRKVYRAIAIRDEWIVAVSEDPHGLDALIEGGTRVIDDADLTLVPAFYDTHQHLIIHAEDMLNVMVDHVTNLAQFLDLIAQHAAQTPTGQWIKTSIGWRESNLAEGRLPTAPELDSVAPNHPVLVKRGGHVAVANSLALALAGITRDTPDPQGGIIQRFPDGTPNGILIERPAFEPVEKLLPPLTVEQKVEGLRLACAEYNALGLGAVRDAAVTPEQMHVYQRLWERQQLTLRSRPMILIPAIGPIADRIALVKGWEVHSGFGDDWLKLEGLKFEMDGGSEAGALEQPYVNNPDYFGKLMWTADELAEVANYAVRSGWKIGTHAVGDRAVRTVLDAYEQVIKDNPGLEPGTLVVEHAFLADAQQRARAIRLGIPITVQHPLLYTLGNELVEKWGKERTHEVMPVRAWLDEGAQLAAGTDYPTSGINDPLWSIWGLVTRGTRDVGIQGPEYAVDQYTAFELYTAAGARLSGESHRRGMLLPNKLADLVGFSADPITCPVDELLSLKPSFTLVGGRVVYDPSGRLGQED